MNQLAQLYDTLSFDNLHPQVHGLTPNAPKVRNLIGDVTNFDDLCQAVKYFNPTIIYHLAAETGTGQSRDEPTRYCDVNVTGTANLAQG